MWITIAIPSTTPRQVTSHGRSPPPCMAQLASREKALSALFAWTVVRDPPWPVLRACNRCGGFAAAHLADDDVIGPVPQGVAHEVADRDGPLLQPARLEPDAVRRINPQLKRVLDGHDPLIIGEQFNERVEQRRLAVPGPAAHEDIPAEEDLVACGSTDADRKEARRDHAVVPVVSLEKVNPPEPFHVPTDFGLDSSVVGERRVETGAAVLILEDPVEVVAAEIAKPRPPPEVVGAYRGQGSIHPGGPRIDFWSERSRP